MEFTQATAEPFPLWVAMVESESEIWDCNDAEIQIALGLRDASFRAVSVDRLATVLRTGVDVEPTTAPMYVSHFLSKALEYGGLPKVVIAFGPEGLDRTFRQVSASLPSDELDKLLERFPTCHESADGQTLWLTRLGPDDPRACKDYEWEYARWIPGDPLTVTQAVILFALRDDMATIADLARVPPPTAS